MLPEPAPWRSIPVPQALIFNPHMASAAVHIWLQLRWLCGANGQTPPLSMQQVVKLTGKSKSSLYPHLIVLRSCGWLQILPEPGSKYIFAFTLPESQPAPVPAGENPPAGAQASPPQEAVCPEFQVSGKLETASLPLNHRNDLIKINPEGEARPKFRNSGKPDSSPADTGPAGQYREVIGYRLNAAQRRLLEQTHLEPELWQQSLEHWQSHGWNPRNLRGMLDLYQRGGPATCRACQAETPANRASQGGRQPSRGGPGLSLKQSQSLEALEQVRQEVTHAQD